jgi:hypothetical protein
MYQTFRTTTRYVIPFIRSSNGGSCSKRFTNASNFQQQKQSSNLLNISEMNSISSLDIGLKKSFSTFATHNLTDLYVKLKNLWKNNAMENPSLNFEIGRVQYYRYQVCVE